MPDYHLYDKWVQEQLNSGVNRKSLTYYLDYSIGFTTRGCIRKCAFCVNKNYNKCTAHSSVSEFLYESRPYICLLDDNIFACSEWKSIFESLNATGKKYQFKQGLDERLLNAEKCEFLFTKANWIGDKIFAFDNIKDADLIIEKLNLIREYTDEVIKFYTFCAFNHDMPNSYNQEFWHKDLSDLFERIRILMDYKCLPYVMKYKDYVKGPYKGLYKAISWWCNQPAFFKKNSFREFCMANQSRSVTECAAMKYLTAAESDFPDVALKYFDMKWED